jgi:hypothetical protein
MDSGMALNLLFNRFSDIQVDHDQDVEYFHSPTLLLEARRPRATGTTNASRPLMSRVPSREFVHVTTHHHGALRYLNQGASPHSRAHRAAPGPGAAASGDGNTRRLSAPQLPWDQQNHPWALTDFETS